MNEKLLDIDHLRSFEVNPAYFGLGFIQLKIKNNARVHFYHDDLPRLVEEPHDHRYGFLSYIIQGRLEQELFQFDENPNGSYCMSWEDCKPGNEKSGPTPLQGDLKDIFHAEYRAGDYYGIHADTLHTVQGIDNAITYLVREEPFKEFAGVVRQIGQDSVCPFSEPISASRCWEMIEDMLPDKHTGYHVRDIPQGTFGEPDKIIEEAYEILDAHEQGVRVMTQVEMSDLFGALDYFREQYHPDISMHDLESMYHVTRRAFKNGDR